MVKLSKLRPDYMEDDVDDDEQSELQIDLSYDSRSESKVSTGSTAEGQSAMTWLQAAEHVLRRGGGPGMHIRELTKTILELGMVKSSCSTSLETLLYRQTSKGTSKFIRVPGKMGWFGLKQAEEEEEVEEKKEEEREKEEGQGEQSRTVPQRPLIVQQLPPQLEHTLAARGTMTEGRREERQSWSFHPTVLYKRKKRTSDYSASGSDDSGWSNSSDEDSEALYHKRYIFTKKMAKSIIYENVAMAEQLDLIEEKIAMAEAERQFLLERFMKFNQKSSLATSLKTKKLITVTDDSATAATNNPVVSGSKSLTTVAGPPPLVPVSSLVVSSASGRHQRDYTVAKASSTSCLSALLTGGDTRVQGPGQSKDGANPETSLGVLPQASQSARSSVSSSSSSDSECETTTTAAAAAAAAVLGAAETGGKTKGGRRKMGTRVRRLHPIPLSEDGSPVMPIQIGGLKVHCLGKIVYDRPAYHSERYLLPVGFHSSRTYPSMLSPSQRTTYHCRILDGGEQPIFEMCAEDDAEVPIQATSSTACQSIVLKAINKARDRQATNSGSGPEFFGYSHPTILNLLQKLPNAGQCSKYKFIKFDNPVVATAATKRKSAGHSGKQRRHKIEGSVDAKKLRLSTSPKPLDSNVGGGSGTAGVSVSHSSTPTDPSLAPVLLGSGRSQLGLETGMGLYSSSEEWSSSETEHELTVDH